MEFANTHTHIQKHKNKRKTYTKHTQEPKQKHTQKPAHICDIQLCLKDRFYHFCHHRVHYQESNISSVVQ